MLPTLLASLAASVLLLASAPAAATASASGVISSLTFQLIDLDPLDGIAPSVTFSAVPRWTVYSRALDTHTYQFDDSQEEGTFGGGPQLFANTMSNAAAQVQVSGDPLLGTAFLGTQSWVEPGGAALSWSTLHGNLILSGHTELVVTARIVMAGSTRLQQESAGASYSLSLAGSTGTSSSSSRWSAYPPPTEDPVQEHSFAIDRVVSVRLRNMETSRVSGVLDAYVGSGGSSNMTLVPEPQTWAMLWVGLACLALRRAGCSSAKVVTPS